MRNLVLLFALAAALVACGSDTGSCSNAPPGSACDSFPDDITPVDVSNDGPRDVGPDAAIPCGGLCGPGTTCDGTRCVSTEAGIVDVAVADDAPADASSNASDGGTRSDVAVADAPPMDSADASADAVLDAVGSDAMRCDSGTLCGGACCAFDCCSGVCVDLQSAVNNCGTCGNVCPPLAHGVRACARGQCDVGACTAPYIRCNGSSDCSTNPLIEWGNCGACGHECGASERCVSGRCEPCPVYDAGGPPIDCSSMGEVPCHTSSDCASCEARFGRQWVCGVSGGRSICMVPTLGVCG